MKHIFKPVGAVDEVMGAYFITMGENSAVEKPREATLHSTEINLLSMPLSIDDLLDRGFPTRSCFPPHLSTAGSENDKKHVLSNSVLHHSLSFPLLILVSHEFITYKSLNKPSDVVQFVNYR